MHTLIRGAMVTMAWLSLSCVGEVGLQGSTGPVGPTGPQGEAGAPARSFTDCPIGYTRDSSAAGIVLCKQGKDEVVKVGRNGSAFWIDRYEASIWKNEDGSGQQYGLSANDFPATFPKNGQATIAVYALSVVSVIPSRYLTWFQANEACRASGKRLPRGDEWVSAARGTQDPPNPNDGSDGSCVTDAPMYRNTGLGIKCVSDWGAQDMIGNASELSADWLAGIGTNPTTVQMPWPNPGYNDDVTLNISSTAVNENRLATPGLPASAIRGGHRFNKQGAGIHYFNADSSPASANDATIGFRCVVPQ